VHASGPSAAQANDTGMDIARSPRKPARVTLIVIICAVLVVASVAALISLLRFEKGVVVDRTTIVTDVVRRGVLVRSVSAAGTLVSEDVRIVSAVQPGVVTVVDVKPGTAVRGGDTIALLENPDLTTAVIAARSSLDVARAQLASAQQEAKTMVLSQQSALAGEQAQLDEDVTAAHSLTSLHRSGLVAEDTYRIAQIKAQQDRRQVSIAQAQVGVTAADAQAKVASADAEVVQAAAALAAHQAQLETLTVKSGATGVVQSVSVEPGAQVAAGTEIVKVAAQHNLKAVLQVPESQIRDVLFGMVVKVDTGNGSAVGHVARIAPSAENGSVAVDVVFPHGLPSGSRPDLNVDGTIEIERLADTLSVARPAGAADGEGINLYRLASGGSRAVLVPVKLGHGSTDRVQVLGGLAQGDIVIVSDTTAYNGQSTLWLH